MNGLKPVPYIVCKICKNVNSHFTDNCSRLICHYCLQSGHAERKCPSKMIYQICGQNSHPTTTCKEKIQKLEF